LYQAGYHGSKCSCMPCAYSQKGPPFM